MLHNLETLPDGRGSLDAVVLSIRYLHGMAKRRKSKVTPVSPAQFVLTVKRRSWGVVLAVVVVLVLLALADRRGVLLYQGEDMARYDGRTFRVVRVVDGDTIDVDVPDGEKLTTRLRLWGIDTPEKALFGKKAEPLSKEATAMTRELTEGQPVTLNLEPHRVRGRFGRLLVYVELADGTILNERLILAGLAESEDRWPHRHLERYELLEDQARKQRLGIWGDKPATPDTTPDTTPATTPTAGPPSR